MKIYKNFELTTYNSYRIKATCKCAYFPESEVDVLWFVSEHPRFILLGSGHNVILLKKHYDIPFLIFNGVLNDIHLLNDEMINVEAGAWMADVADFALQNSLSGIEVFCDIPSSLGGAVVMNAGANGEEIKDVIHEVRYFDLNEGICKFLSGNDLSFQYRNSFFQLNPRNLILSASLRLKPTSREDINNKMAEIKRSRGLKQPKEFPNAGSVFKRPKGFFVGTLIEELGLKGYSVGGMKISEKHGGFIVNYNNGTGQDILKIIHHVQNRVYEVYGLELEIEQRIL